MNIFKTLAMVGLVGVGVVYAEDGGFHTSSLRPVTPEELRSPVNTVFQFTQEGVFSGWPDGSKTTARAYLWVPEECKKLRGILVLCANVPEMMLAGHPEIRKVCRENDLGIVWCPRTFFNFKRFGPEKKLADAEAVAFLQQLLGGLASTSGYPEVATVPWIPIGESSHLLMADALVEAAPGRTIAGIWLKNPHLPPHDRTTPALVIYGSAQEWAQDKPDTNRNTTFLNRWATNALHYDSVLKGRQANPDWPLSYALDGQSGHFDCSEKVVGMVARYIKQATKARLPREGGTHLIPVDLTKGFLAELPAPGHGALPVTSWNDTPASNRSLPWFFDKESAEAAQALGHIDWKAKSQLPAFAATNGAVMPFLFNGISSIAINARPKPWTNAATGAVSNAPVIITEPDGITFHLKGVLLDRVPETFAGAGAGEQLEKTPGEPVVEWMSGCIEPLGNGTFRIAPDRNWPSVPTYMAVRQPGTSGVRGVVQPGGVDVGEINSEGTPQKITFEPIPDVKAGSESITLKARSDSGLPVRFFVDAGPAVIQGDKLVFTTIPPNAKLPLTVTVGAWQLGRWAEPKIRKADVVKQSFRILPAN
jgi:hypothetical protein